MVWMSGGWWWRVVETGVVGRWVGGGSGNDGGVMVVGNGGDG